MSEIEKISSYSYRKRILKLQYTTNNLTGQEYYYINGKRCSKSHFWGRVEALNKYDRVYWETKHGHNKTTSFYVEWEYSSRKE